MVTVVCQCSKVFHLLKMEHLTHAQLKERKGLPHPSTSLGCLICNIHYILYFRINYMKFTLIISIIFITIGSVDYSFGQTETRLYWHQDSLLRWSDFKGPIDTTSQHSAAVTWSTEYNWKAKWKNNIYTLSFTTKAFAIPSKSWSKVAQQTPKLLKHEQVHFDIVEFFSRKELAALTNHVYNASYKSDMTSIVQRIDKKIKEMQELYDNQTDHSKNEDMQVKWEAFVADILKKNYSIDQAFSMAPIGVTTAAVPNPSQ